MADASETGLFPRTYFRAPRVPFDFRALALAVVGYLVWLGGSALLEKAFDRDVTSAFLGAVWSILRGIPYLADMIGYLFEFVFRTEVVNLRPEDIGLGHALAGGIWFFGVWSFVGQAVHRITALRISRDEGLTIGEALRFAAGNWATILLAPVIVLGVIGFFWLCNLAAGAAVSIPIAGGILSLILVPLAWISTLLILLVAVGGMLGLPLVASAAAWERNGSLDAISRAFSYVFARPVQFFWSYFLVFLFVGMVLLVGQWFLYTLTKSIDAGVWADPVTVLVDAPPYSTAEGSDWQDLSNEAKTLDKELTDLRDIPPGGERSAPAVSPHGLSVHALGKTPWTHWLTALVFWLTLNLTAFGICGYAIWWFMGATTSVYADLREDVDGTPEDEIFLEEEQEPAPPFDAPPGEAGAGGDAGAPPSPPPSGPPPPPPAGGS